MVRVGNLSVRLIDSSTQRAFPEVSHGGMTYVVCQSGADYHVEAQSHCGHRTKGVITVDGDLVDYRCNISIGRGPTSFYGFPLRERDAHGKKRFRAFQFSHTQIAEPGSAAAAKAAKADDDDDSMVGTVLFELFPAEKTAQKTKKHRAGSGSGFCGGGGGDKLVKKKGGQGGDDGDGGRDRRHLLHHGHRHLQGLLHDDLSELSLLEAEQGAVPVAAGDEQFLSISGPGGIGQASVVQSLHDGEGL